VIHVVGPNFGAGMTGGRAYMWDPSGTSIAAADTSSVRWTRLRSVVGAREDGAERAAELRSLLEGHREAGSALARALLARPAQLGDSIWLIEPIGSQLPVAIPVGDVSATTAGTTAQPVA
jgi:glutamate synthase domain-containing protein 3